MSEPTARGAAWLQEAWNLARSEGGSKAATGARGRPQGLLARFSSRGDGSFFPPAPRLEPARDFQRGERAAESDLAGPLAIAVHETFPSMEVSSLPGRGGGADPGHAKG